MVERTLVLVKPDGVKRALIGKIIARLEIAGMKVVAMKMVVPDKKLAGIHYIADQKWFIDTGTKSMKAYQEKGIKIKEKTPVELAKKIRGYLIEYIANQPIVAIVFEGNEAISVTRKIVGATEPKRADPSTIRGMYSVDSYECSDSRKQPIKNIVHASEDKKTADREIAVWFKPSEIIKYERADQNALY
ncbi:MAG: nucleoside-diphosphate kinase [Candidatus Micrarchaeaceae archaeon]|jgi:nucleoside-diphosphate kinase